MEVFIILGGSGGVLGLIGAVWLFGKGIFRQVTATEENTRALGELSGKLEAVMAKLGQHDVDIAVLKDRVNHS